MLSKAELRAARDQRDAEDADKEAPEDEGGEKGNTHPVPDRIAKQFRAMVKHMFEHTTPQLGIVLRCTR
jgi:hypothetical protein